MGAERNLVGAALLLVASWSTGSGESLCIEPTEIGDINGTVNCQEPIPSLFENHWIGFSEVHSELCADCPPDDAGRPCVSGYAWSISSSSTDPLSNSGFLPEDSWLYLWLVQDDAWGAGGFSAAEFALTGTLAPREFEPLNGVEWFLPEAFPDLLITVPECEGVPFLAGRVLVDDPSPIARHSWGRAKAMYK